MADALVSALIDQLVSVAFRRLDEEMRLVKDVDEDVRQLKTNLEAIQAVLEDAERRQLADQSVRNWLDRLKDVSFDMDNVLDEWSTAILKLRIEEEKGENGVPTHQTSEKVCFSIPSPFSCFKSKVNRITLRHDIAHKIKDLNQKLDRIAGEKDRFMLKATITEQPVERPKTTSFVNEVEIYGRDKDKDILVSKLLSENSTHEDKSFNIIPIVGMGGMGKTTLAQLVYNDEKVKDNFDERIWVCVSDPFEEIKVAKAIVESIEGSSPNNNELDPLLQRIHKCIEGKRFLLVLDDVWTDDKQKWEQLRQPLKNGAVGSRILVTTRKKEVAIMMGVVNSMVTLEELSEEHCWLIFKQLAFLEREEEERKQLEEIGRRIASKAKGSPLVAKTLGGLMCYKENQTQWRDVLDSELWQSKDVKKIFTPFLLSYYDLSPKEKQCLLYCSVFPKDYRIDRDQLIEMWMSQSYLGYGTNSDEEGRECFETLARRSFFQNFERLEYDSSITCCTMHDIVHDFVQFLTKDEYITMEVNSSVEKKLTLVNEIKARHLTLVLGSDAQSLALEYNKTNEENLRTLFVPDTNNYSVNASLFLRLTFLRTLTLSNCGIRKLPESIGRLMHLRYLNLKDDKMEELPDALCDLWNLQTLDLSTCTSLRRLPEGIGKLINLKHLYAWSCFDLEGFPRGIGSLTCLQKLDTLIIPRDKGAFSDIGDFTRLKNLRLAKYLSIRGCRNVKNVEEAEKIDLKNCDSIIHLILDFGKLGNQNWGFANDAAILEALEPHPNLAILMISDYMGASLSPRPRWITSLTNLRDLRLFDCNNLETVPSFGKMPCLEFLKLSYMKSVKMLGLEFLGIAEEKDQKDFAPIISFPKLENLVFDSMARFEKWEGSVTTTTTETSSSFMIMPCLKHLEFGKCPRLQALPEFLQTSTSLKDLSITESEIMEEYCRKGTGEEWDKISHVPNISVNGEYVRKDGIWIHKDN
ncbi:NB-ARC domain containing protein [Trema orientale]|uniref:NB-ARC domain containing protein n=1 Tax=Trema orientale TaxID=63057 RepID=A0A2P5D7B2_TREOI|nr:NB-ARC domain containing protein [Trema orientale]